MDGYSCCIVELLFIRHHHSLRNIRCHLHLPLLGQQVLVGLFFVLVRLVVDHLLPLLHHHPRHLHLRLHLDQHCLVAVVAVVEVEVEVEVVDNLVDCMDIDYMGTGCMDHSRVGVVVQVVVEVEVVDNSHLLLPRIRNIHI